MSVKTFTISEIASLFGISTRTLRFYEHRGLIRPARIGASRYYSVREKAQVELIMKGKRLGFTLSEIERLLASGRKVATDYKRLNLDRAKMTNQILHLERKREALDVAIRELEEALEAKA